MQLPRSLQKAQNVHIVSIDILRALTMILMIFVNDLWSLKNIPDSLGHVAHGVDGIGLADVVFPAFLFIVGLSLPYAITNRRSRGNSNWQLVLHVCIRTVALLTMGVFLVNGETINASATGITRTVWNSVCCLCFVLLWNTYPNSLNKIFIAVLRGAAISLLVVFAFLYRGGEDDNLSYFGTQWWGILGLIGWAYWVSGLVLIAVKNKFYGVLGAWIFFAILSMLYHDGWVPPILNFIPHAILGGTLVALTLGGSCISLLVQYFSADKRYGLLTLVLVLITALFIGLSIITRPYWGLAKLGATPAWLFLCSAFTTLVFLFLYWLADVFQKGHWFNVIKPAGTATLLCYLMPYFVYAFTHAVGIDIPGIFLEGTLGLLKSFLFALFCVFLTGGLLRMGVRMKL